MTLMSYSHVGGKIKIENIKRRTFNLYKRSQKQWYEEDTHTHKKVIIFLSKHILERLKMVLKNKEGRIKKQILMNQGKKT